MPAALDTRAWRSAEKFEAVSVVVVVGVGEPYVLVGSKFCFSDRELDDNSLPAALRRG